MNKVYFIFGIHNHQPVGNFDNVLEEGYQKSYNPFLELMSKHPKIKWTLHCSGILWDYFSAKHPHYIEQVQKMADSGQVELMTGGYYEPILPVIPDRDKKGQIGMMTSFIEKTFGASCKGLWLAERVWEPHLAKVLSESGVEYIVVDDAHFAAAGMDIEKLDGYYVTEEQGVKLNIFPISQRMRYYVPFQTIEKNLEYFGEVAKHGNNPLLVMADDGEKFGMWPETFKHVYQDRWLERFLDLLEQNSSWIETITFSEYLKKFPPKGRVYLPAASYFEMSEWSLPQDSQEEFERIVKQFESQPQVKRFLRGGFWRNFLTKYHESNIMHKKMMYVSEKVNDFAKGASAVTANIKAKANDAAPTESQLMFSSLYQGQCNCAYWHGVFGGLYLPHLRTAVYRKLLDAEKAVNEHITKPKWKRFDIDKDGKEELLFETPAQNAYISPQRGGSLFEWDILSKSLNMLNVLTRRKEAYHSRLIEFLAKNPQAGSESGVKTIHDIVKVKEGNLDKHLNYDWYNRVSLLDHFLHPDTAFEDFKFCRYGEQGDFVLGEYTAKSSGNSLLLKRAGSVWVSNRSCQVEVLKKVCPEGQLLKIEYELKNYDSREIDVSFAPEFAFAFSFGKNNEDSITDNVSEWLRKDEGFGFNLKMKLSHSALLWTFPIETVSLSEGGFEKTYQGTVVLPIFKVKIPAKESFSVNILIEIKNI